MRNTTIELNTAYYVYDLSKDSVHFNEEGRKRIGAKIITAIESSKE